MKNVMSLFMKRVPAHEKPAVSLHIKATLLANVDEAVKQKRVSSRLAAGAVNVGDLCMEGGLHVIGTHEGQLIITGDAGVVWINESGAVTGDIEAPQVYVQGRVKGSVHAEFVIIEGKGRIEGEIRANRVLLRHVADIGMYTRILPKETVVGQAAANPSIVPIAATA